MMEGCGPGAMTVSGKKYSWGPERGALRAPILLAEFLLDLCLLGKTQGRYKKEIILVLVCNRCFLGKRVAAKMGHSFGSF